MVLAMAMTIAMARATVLARDIFTNSYPQNMWVTL